MLKPFSFPARLRSFRHAFRGLRTMLRTQQNAWIHAVATVAVVIAAFAWEISKAEWLWILLAIMAVWSAEAINTAFEFLADAAHPGFHPLIKKAKDLAAGAVLLAAIGAALIGVLVFGPCLLRSMGLPGG